MNEKKDVFIYLERRQAKHTCKTRISFYSFHSDFLQRIRKNIKINTITNLSFIFTYSHGILVNHPIYLNNIKYINNESFL